MEKRFAKIKAEKCCSPGTHNARIQFKWHIKIINKTKSTLIACLNAIQWEPVPAHQNVTARVREYGRQSWIHYSADSSAITMGNFFQVVWSTFARLTTIPDGIRICWIWLGAATWFIFISKRVHIAGGEQLNAEQLNSGSWRETSWNFLLMCLLFRNLLHDARDPRG